MAFSTILLRAVDANWNADNGGWNVNANSVENPNEWYADNRVFSRNSLKFLPPYVAGVLFCRPFIHPPSIRPISFNRSDMAIYFLSSKILISQPIWKKNFKRSNLFLDFSSIGIFCSLPK